MAACYNIECFSSPEKWLTSLSLFELSKKNDKEKEQNMLKLFKENLLVLKQTRCSRGCSINSLVIN